MKKPMNEMKVTFPSRSANEGFARATVAAVETDDAQLALAFLCKKGYTVPKDQPEADRVMGALAGLERLSVFETVAPAAKPKGAYKR